MTRPRVWLCLLTASILAGCGRLPAVPRSVAMDQQLASDVDLVSQARVYFGHQSVGDNIMAGLRDVTEGRVAIAPVADRDPRQGDEEPLFLHSTIGQNGYPTTKLTGFEAAVDQLNRGSRPLDVALMKFCYLDVLAQTDSEALLADYSARLANLQARYPTTLFVHVTMPLKADEGIKGLVKMLIGRGNPTDDNIQRNRYNAMLREHFRDEPIFDLAAIESTGDDGSRSLFEKGTASYEELAPGYSSDGGHLNAYGSLRAARALVGLLRRRLNSIARPPAHAGQAGDVLPHGAAPASPPRPRRLAARGGSHDGIRHAIIPGLRLLLQILLDIFSRRALPAGRLRVSVLRHDFHHGLLYAWHRRHRVRRWGRAVRRRNDLADDRGDRAPGPDDSGNLLVQPGAGSRTRAEHRLTSPAAPSR